MQIIMPTKALKASTPKLLRTAGAEAWTKPSMTSLSAGGAAGVPMSAESAGTPATVVTSLSSSAGTP